MKILNFKLFRHEKKQAVPTRQERKQEAKRAKAERIKNLLKEIQQKPFYGPAHRPSPMVNTRQCRRAQLMHKSFEEITNKFPGELRNIRRSMARDLAKRLKQGRAA